MIIDPLRAEVTELRNALAAAQAEAAALRRELEELRGGKKPPPSWVKPNRPPRPEARPPRKKRDGADCRRREPAERVTEQISHAVERCPDCGRKLTGGWVHSTRQVLEVPLAQLRIIEHRMMGRWCGVGKQRLLPQVSAADLGVSGKRRFGIGFQSWISTLHVAGRVPLRTICALVWVQ
ncbi:MAG: hypothetical protein HY320_05205 [Armatimonadetes bacterium]|nr:hypothetical protein [Armatimonadota bacterium]